MRVAYIYVAYNSQSFRNSRKNHHHETETNSIALENNVTQCIIYK